MIELSPVEIQAILLSLKVASVSVVLTMPLALCFAWVLARLEFPGKILLDSLIHLPLVLPPVAVGFLLLVILGRNGVVGSWLFETLGIEIAFTWMGAAIAASVMGFPLVVRAIRLSIEMVDTRLEAAARTLGASSLAVFFTVTLPLAMPGVLVGAVLGFARALGEFGATITFAGNIQGETQTLPSALYLAHQSPGGEEMAVRLAILSIIIALVALVGSELFARRLRRSLYGV